VGQKGYGLTVFQGTTPERFEFEVLGIVKNFLPKEHIILVKSDDPKLAVTGFAAGMSGSPLFIDGKIACAFSFGFRFNKVAIGGCTPLEYMLEDAHRPLRGKETTALASQEEWNRFEPIKKFLSPVLATQRHESFLLRPPLPTVPPSAARESDLVRATVPLSISGLGPSAFEQARQIFAPLGIEPMQAGGGSGDPGRGPDKFELGGPIGVQLISGDVSAVGTGTVSYIDGSKVLGFGHWMFMFGETYMPVVAAEIHTIIPSATQAFKLSSPLRVLGSLVQDRQSSITADTTKLAETVPVDIFVSNGTESKVFHSDVVRNRFLLPPMVGVTVSSAAQTLTPDVADVVVAIDSKIHVRGHEPLAFSDYLFSPEGATANVISSARALRVLVPLLFNPFEPVTIDRIEVRMRIAYKNDYNEIKAVRIPHIQLPFGKKTYVDVVLKSYAGGEYVERIPLTIPERLAGSLVKLEITPGDATKIDAAPPESLSDVMASLRKTYPSTVLVATVYTPDEGVTLGGKVIANLPDSAIDTVRPAASTRRGEAYKSMARTVVPMQRVISGKQELIVKVEDLK
jgi:hypothetical protein